MRLKFFTLHGCGRFSFTFASDVDHDAEELDRLALDLVNVDIVTKPDRPAVGCDEAVNEFMIAAGHGLVMTEHRDVPVVGVKVLGPEMGLLDPA
jgi:hypothetical protein